VVGTVVSGPFIHIVLEGKRRGTQAGGEMPSREDSNAWTSAVVRDLSPTSQLPGLWLQRRQGYLSSSEHLPLELIWKSNFQSQSTGLALLLSEGCVVGRRE
jgi:hypothetical protein